MTMIEQSNTIGALAGALAAAAPGLREARKDRRNTHMKNAYATLEAILEAVREPLALQGVAITQGVSADGGRVTVTTQLSHSSGEWMRTSLTIPVPENKALTVVQSMGSTITYGRRYTLSALCGLGAEERDEDDGEAERAPPRRGRDELPPEREERQAGHHPSWAAAQKGTMARLRDIGMTYEQANAWLSDHGRPRLSGMDPETREKALAYFGRDRSDAPPAAR
jgi:hypothetical protein